MHLSIYLSIYKGLMCTFRASSYKRTFVMDASYDLGQPFRPRQIFFRVVV